MSLDKFVIKKTAQNIIDHFDQDAVIEVAENNGGFDLNIQTEISGILIGRHGETLEALQHILRLVLMRELKEFIPIQVDVSGYRALRQKELEESAQNAAQKVLDTGQSETLPPMAAYERRLVHLVLQKIKGIKTESVGEEPERRIIIKKISKF